MNSDLDRARPRSTTTRESGVGTSTDDVEGVPVTVQGVEPGSLGFRTDLMVARLAGSQVEQRGDWWLVRTPTNPGFWWGNYLLAPAPLPPGDAGAWESRFKADLPFATHRAFGVDGTEGDVGDPEELARLRVEPDVSTVLTATRLREPHGSGALCRALHGDEDWRQLVELRVAVYPDSGAAFVALRTAEDRRAAESGGAWFGAFVDGQLACALGIITGGGPLARYQNVQTHPDHRRRGLAKQLVHLAGEHAREHLQAETLVIVADPSYHAITLYRDLGFVEAEQQVQLQRAPG